MNTQQESHKSVVVPRQLGLRRRVVLATVNLAQRFHSDILLSAGTLQIDAKSSLMAMMVLAALKGQMVELSARGPDSALAVKSISSLFEGTRERK